MALASTFVDTFPGTSLDTTKWIANSQVTVASNTASIPSLTSYPSLFSAAAYTLTGSSLFAKITPPAGLTGAEQMFFVLQDGADNNHAQVYVYGTGNIAFQVKIAGTVVYDQTTTLTAATNPGWWRIREASKTLYLDSSPDGTTWTNRLSYTYTGTLPDMYVNAVSANYNADAPTNPTKIASLNTATATPSYSGTTALAGSGTLTAAGKPVVSRTTPLTGSGSSTRTGNATTSGATARTGSGTLTPSGSPSETATLALTGNGSLAPAGTPTLTGTSSATGAGQLAATGNASTTGTATLNGTGELTISDTVTANGALTTAGYGTLTAAGAPNITGATNLNGTGTVAASGQPTIAATFVSSGDGTLTFSTAAQRAGNLSLTGNGALTATGHASTTGALNLAGNSTTTQAGTPSATSTTALTGTGTLNTTGSLTSVNTTTLTGTGTLTAIRAATNHDITITGTLSSRAWGGTLTGEHRTGTLGTPDDGKAHSMSYPRETVEYITVNVNQDGAPITTNIELSVVTAGQRPDTWTPAEIVDGKTVYLINAMTPGTYTIWSRTTPNGTEERPVINHGTFRVD